MTATPSKSVPAKTAPAKAPAKAAPGPAFSLDNLTVVEDAPPRRNDGVSVSENVLRALRDSWDNRTELTKAKDAVPAKDGKPARPAVRATYLGAGRAFPNIPNADAAKLVESQIRKGAAQLNVGVSIRTEEKDGKYVVRFAAKSLKTKRAA